MIWAAIALALGGILKGATGAGAPIIAVPVMAMLYDVPLAIVVFSVPSLLSNLWQAWAYRAHALPPRFLLLFAGAGMLGVSAGTAILASLPADMLLLVVAGAVFLYVGFRIARPGWSLAHGTATRLAFAAGFAGGMLQGAGGVSAPVSVTFLNAMRLPRPEFVATISVFFFTMALPQIPLLAWYGFMTWERLLWSCAALVPLVAFMPVGAWLGRQFSREAFDRVILGLLLVIGLKLVFDGLT